MSLCKMAPNIKQNIQQNDIEQNYNQKSDIEQNDSM